jgi:hypothetical protein
VDDFVMTVLTWLVVLFGAAWVGAATGVAVVCRVLRNRGYAVVSDYRLLSVSMEGVHPTTGTLVHLRFGAASKFRDYRL